MDLEKVLASFPREWLHFFGHISVTVDRHGCCEAWLRQQRESSYRSTNYLDLEGLVSSLAEEEVVATDGELCYRPRILCLPIRLQESILLFLSRNVYRLSARSRATLASALDSHEERAVLLDAGVASLWRILMLQLRGRAEATRGREYYKFSQASSNVTERLTAAACRCPLRTTADADSDLFEQSYRECAAVTPSDENACSTQVPDGYVAADSSNQLTSRDSRTYLPQISDLLEQRRVADALNLVAEAFFSCSSDDLSAVLDSIRSFVPEEDEWTLWSTLCHRSAAVSHANSVLLCSRLVRAQLAGLTGYARRDMAVALSVVLQTFPEVAIKEAIAPVVLSSSFSSEQCECILRILKGQEFLAISADILECTASSSSAWTDARLVLIEGLVKSASTLSSQTLLSLVDGLKINAVTRSSDLKYGKLVLDVTSRYLPQMDKSSVDDIRGIAACHRTFVAKAITGLLARCS